MSAHTPGPWEHGVITEGKRKGHRAVFPRGETVTSGIADVNALYDEAEANARLVAAAPELLDALKNLLAAGGTGRKRCGHDFVCVCPEEFARAAIAKVEGKS